MRCTVTPTEGSFGCGGVGEVELAWTPVHAGPPPATTPTVAAAEVGAPLAPPLRDRVRLRRGLRRAQPVVLRRQLAATTTYELRLLLRDRSGRLTASERWFLLPAPASEVPGTSVAAMHVHGGAPFFPEVPGTSGVGTAVGAEVPGTSGWRLVRNLPALVAGWARRHDVRFDPPRPATGGQR